MFFIYRINNSVQKAIFYGDYLQKALINDSFIRYI